MACPICGANCRCKKRGPSGLCCKCHRHKPSAAKLQAYIAANPDAPAELRPALEQHLEWLKDSANVKTVSEAMAHGNGAQMCRESPQWNPSRWSWNKRERFIKRVWLHLMREFTLEFGAYEGTRKYIEVVSGYGAALSGELLRNRGVKTLGELENGDTSTTPRE